LPDSLMERYAREPDSIERRSLDMVEAAIPACSGWTSAAREVVKRMIYSVGDLALAGLTRVHLDAIEAGLEAVRAGAPIVCDVRMVAAGLRPCDNTVHVAVDRIERGTRRYTRAAAGMRELHEELDGALAVIGNAPTALLALLDMIDANRCRPALIIGTPVGFVAAAESKQELIQRDVPYITVEGSRGGSPIAAAAMNALLILGAPSQASSPLTP